MMKSTYYIPLALAIAAIAPAAPVEASPAVTSATQLMQAPTVSDQLLPCPRQWHHGSAALRQGSLEKRRAARKIVTEADTKIGPADSFGTLTGPDGSEWLYTADYEYDARGFYTAVKFEIYDGNNKQLGTISHTFTLGENEIGVNYVQLNPNITRKFFNIDDKYEVILFIHTVTADYAGHYYQKVYTIGGDQTEPLATIEGNEIMMENFATDAYMEHYQMVMQREEFVGDDYFIHYDIYGWADWSSMNAPRLLHTFTVDYTYISGLGDTASPILLKSVDGKPVYALQHYEKPYFDPSVAVWEEPVVTPDNTFIIDLYDGSSLDGTPRDLEPYTTVRIPMDTDEGYLYTFPCLGPFLGQDDLSYGVFNDSDEPVFVVSHENYSTSSDDFSVSVYLYDKEGNRIGTVAENMDGYMQLCAVPGEEMQFVTYNLDEGCYRFLNIPSCTQQTPIPFALDDLVLSTSMDRIPRGTSYQYAFAVTIGQVTPDGSVVQAIAWFNPDGTFDRWESIDLGTDIFLAQVAVVGEWLNPYIFDTDPAYDYMVLVKQAGPSYAIDNKLEERFFVRSSTGKKLLDFGPSDEMGEIDNIWLVNPALDNPTLVVDYYDWNSGSYIVNFTSLPLEMFAGGSGTPDDPYLISSVGDLYMTSKAPAASYRVVNDIDCKYDGFAGCTGAFSGEIDGAGHKIYNLNLQGASLFGEFEGSAYVHDLVFEAPIVCPDYSTSGLLCTSAVYNGSVAPRIERVHVYDLKVENPDFRETFGGLVGQTSTGTTITECSVVDADICLPRATVGGLVGSTSSSETNMSCSAFTGTIEAAVAGGIAGDAISLLASDLYVDADITASRACGGIVGNQGQYMLRRATLQRAVVRGSLTSTATDDPCAGGIIGSLEAGDNLVAASCLVGLNNITVEASVEKLTAHAIVGHSCADEPGEILWDDPWWNTVENPYADPSLWPRAEVQPDGGLADNYVLDTCSLPGSPEANDAKSVDGQSISVDNVTSDFLSSLGYALGTTTEQPWAIDESGLPMLHYLVGGHDGVIGVTKPSLSFDGQAITAPEGPIALYDLGGNCLRTGLSTLSTAGLPAGIYIARTPAGALKLVLRGGC